MQPFLTELRERRIPQIVGGYLAAGWVVLQLVDQLVGNKILPQAAYPIALVTYLFGIPAAGALAWFHGRRGHQRFARSELGLLGVIGALWISALSAFVVGGEDPRPAPVEKGRQAPATAIGGHFLIVPFRNLSGSADYEWLVDGSPSLLADILGQWREIDVVPPERMYAALQPHRGQTPLGVDALAKMARATGASTVVSGEVLKAGSALTVSARVFDIATGRVVLDARETVAPGEDVRAAYERVATQLLRAAGLPDATVDLRGVTTHSLEAYQAYSAGIAHLQRSQFRSAERAFRSAVKLDSMFAQAWAYLASVSMQSVKNLLDERSAAYAYTAKAAELSVRLPERQRRYIQVVHAMSRGQFTLARAELDKLIAQDSTDIESLITLIDLELADPIVIRINNQDRLRASFNRAVATAEQVLRIDPSRHAMYRLLATLYTRLADPRATRTMPPSPIIYAFRNEQPSLIRYVNTVPDVVFHAVLRDSISALPLGVVAKWPADSLAASRARAREKARSWIDRWLVVAPRSADAHLAASRIAELDQNIVAAAAAQEAAEALGAGEEGTAIAINRVALRAKQRRFNEAIAIADSLQQAGYYEDVRLATVQSDGIGYAYALYLMRVDSAGTQRLIRAFARQLRPFVPQMAAGGMIPKLPESEEELEQLTQSVSIALFASSKQGDMRLGQYPTPTAAAPAFLFEALDSLAANPRKWPRTGMMMQTLPTLFSYAAFAADSASARRAAGRALELATALKTDPAWSGIAQRLEEQAARYVGVPARR